MRRLTIPDPILSRSKAARGLAAVLALLVLLPVLLRLIGLPSRKQAYLTMEDESGPVGNMVHTIFDESGDVDVLFLGTSPTMHAIAWTDMERDLSQELGRPVRVRVLAMSWGGYDLDYFMLRDYLQSHHPSLVVLEAPHENTMYTSPHQTMHQWLRFGDYPDAVTQLPLRYQAQIYAEEVIGGPRQLLNLLRSNGLKPGEEDPEAYYRYVHRLWFHNLNDPSYIPSQAFQAVDFQTVSLSTHVAETIGDPNVQLVQSWDSGYSAAFLRLIGQIASQQKLRLICAHYPYSTEFGEYTIPAYCHLDKLLGQDCPLIGPPSGEVFGKVGRAAYNAYFGDWAHLNSNGVRVFDRVLEGQLLPFLDGTREQTQPISKESVALQSVDSMPQNFRSSLSVVRPPAPNLTPPRERSVSLRTGRGG
jgi:hypothetical protein